MINLKLPFLLAFIFSFFVSHAQNEIPKGFSKGSIVLSDGTVVSGYIKEKIRNNASILVMSETGGKKKSYDGDKLISAEIDSTSFLCIKGDFFKILCAGELSFLQKASDASGKPVYNGTEAMFTNGTDGKPDDYFIYDVKQKQLKLVTGKNVGEVAAASFIDCAEALTKAKETGTNVAMLREAVKIYNNRRGK